MYKDKVTDRVYCPVCQFPVDPDGPIPLDDIMLSRFIEIVKKPALILFWAPWEKSSEEMYTHLAGESQRTGRNIITASVNISENPESRRHYGIEILPTFVIMAFGREINRVIGPISNFELSRLLRHNHF
ncbi:thioredoxin family protein [bacterium]|nr:thioredoxin family protein [bacterium]